MNTLRQYLVNREHHQFRQDHPEYDDLCRQYSALGLDPKERMTRRFELLASLETPVLLPDEKICFMRTITKIPDCFTQEEWQQIKSGHFIHELGYLSNLSPNYERVIAAGLLKCREDADVYGRRVIDAILSLSDRYKEEAEKQGNEELAAVLARVPRYSKYKSPHRRNRPSDRVY